MPPIKKGGVGVELHND